MGQAGLVHISGSVQGFVFLLPKSSLKRQTQKKVDSKSKSCPWVSLKTSAGSPTALFPLRPKGIITLLIIESHHLQQAGAAHGILTKADRQA